MDLASAYPNSDLSALTMTIIAVVIAAALAVWLGLVFLAAGWSAPTRKHSPPRERQGRQGRAGLPGPGTAPAEPGIPDHEQDELEGQHARHSHRGVAA
ncbi:hypothetical protein [Trebonia sp.]|uniref:hypothetical protein n=1 Tax=Trebonia sp. TaxID=2767075 RepID=UPI002631B6C4|nr:hypothetical protein [Trebonia sp.]